MLKLDAFWSILAPEAQRPLLQLGKDAISRGKTFPFFEEGHHLSTRNQTGKSSHERHVSDAAVSGTGRA